VRIYTRKGDDGTTGLFHGGRVRKDSPAPEAYGTVDEAQAVIGVARAEAERGSELDTLLVRLERELWTVMSELATDAANREKLGPDSVVTKDMVAALEPLIDDLTARFDAPTDFVVPGQNRVSDLLWTMARWQEGEHLLTRQGPRERNA
jgi:cob(I)alamin adenosyltransferase